MGASTSHDDAAMTEPLACAVHAVGRTGGVEARDVLVTGGGPIGALVAQVARLRGARRVLVTDPHPDDGQRSRRAASMPSTRATVLAWRHSRRGSVNAVRVLPSSAPGWSRAPRVLASVVRGGVVIVVGVYPGRPRADILATVQDHELDVRGSLMYTWADFREAGRLIDEGRVRLSPLRTHHVPFARWLDGYRLIDDPGAGAMKVMVDMPA